MKTWKLISGILSIVMFFMVSLQSCAAGAYNALSDNGEISGSAGLLVAFLLLSGGVVSICARNSKKGGNIAITIIYGIAALVGFACAGSYADLNIWAFWCLICCLLAVVDFIKNRKTE